jgi:hypothetical protein
VLCFANSNTLLCGPISIKLCTVELEKMLSTHVESRCLWSILNSSLLAHTIHFGLSSCCTRIKWHILTTEAALYTGLIQLRTYLQTCTFTFFISLLFLITSLVNLTESLLSGINFSKVSCICVKPPLEPITMHVTTMTKPRPFHLLHEFVWFPVNLVYCNQILYIIQLSPLVCEVSLPISLPRQIQVRCLAVNHNSPAVWDKL